MIAKDSVRVIMNSHLKSEIGPFPKFRFIETNMTKLIHSETSPTIEDLLTLHNKTSSKEEPELPF